MKHLSNILLIILSLAIFRDLEAQIINANLSSFEVNKEKQNLIKSENNYLENRNECLRVLPFGLESCVKNIYQDGTYVLKSSNQLNLKSLICFLNISDDYTFKESRSSISRINKERIYKFYQQYYKGVLIEGAGFTTLIDINSGKIVEFSPSIISNLNFDIKTVKLVSDIKYPDSILNDSFEMEDLRIVFLNKKYNLIRLCYKSEHGEFQKLYIDPLNGDTLLKTPTMVNLMAQTPTYGNVNLNTRVVNGVHSLQWPSGSSQTLGVYEFNPMPFGTPGVFTENKIPTTTHSNWNINSNYVSRQAFYAASAVIPSFQNMGVTFGNVHIATHATTPVQNAWAYSFSTIENAYIGVGVFGFNGSGPLMATYDFIAHELGHVYLFPFIDSGDSQKGGSLHEGISDIIGCFIESFIHPSTDWIMGGDVPALATAIDRDLSERVCLSDLNNASTHTRGLVIGHWFYAISTGIANDNIPSLGLQNSMDILIDALVGLNNINPSFQDMRERTLTVALENYGQCSAQYKAIANAWARVCVNGSILDCPCDDYLAPTLSTNYISNICGQGELNLNLLHTSGAPLNTELI